LREQVALLVARMETLRVEVADASLLSLYVPTQESAINRSDSGFDLYMAADTVLDPNETRLLDLQVRAELLPGAGGPHGYYLFPRSSISKTPLRLANSVGIIDFGYRGTLKVAVHNTGPVAYTIRRGERLFQLCMPSLNPFQVAFGVVSRATERGEGGFGSTTAFTDPAAVSKSVS
jgi:dUTP pyrophosphatase